MPTRCWPRPSAAIAPPWLGDAPIAGKTLLLLPPFIPDCRWGLHREDCPRYPTARLLRQSAAGDWSRVIAMAAALLA
jgi:hypothetical protein